MNIIMNEPKGKLTAMEVSAEEAEIICNLRRANEECFTAMRRVANNFAKKFPRHEKPALRLVAGRAA